MFKKVGALMQRLLVGIGADDLLLAGSGNGQQRVLDLDLDAAHDVQVILQHQVVVVGYRAGKGVFNRDDAVAALA